MAKNSPETLKKRNELKRHWKKITDPNSFPHTIQKHCKDCKKVKDCQWQHSFTQTGTPEYRVRCVECHKEYLKKVRKQPESKKKRNNKRKEFLRNRKIYGIKLLGGKCSKCGYTNNLSALTFHHTDPSKKLFDIGQVLDRKDVLDRELKKCILLCFNCHMEIEHPNDSHF